MSISRPIQFIIDGRVLYSGYFHGWTQDSDNCDKLGAIIEDAADGSMRLVSENLRCLRFTDGGPQFNVPRSTKS